MKTSSKTVLIAAILLCSVASSFAWLRRHYSDEEIVARASYIVVGKIQDGTLAMVSHDGSHEYHVDLMISEVLKGQIASNSITVSIHYGLDPMAGRFGSGTNGVLEIYDTGNSAMNGWHSGDIHTNQIWLLHQERNPSLDNSDWIGIYDPEDIQPVSKKSELLRYLK
jgi:hypothetical protein